MKMKLVNFVKFVTKIIIIFFISLMSTTGLEPSTSIEERNTGYGWTRNYWITKIICKAKSKP